MTGRERVEAALRGEQPELGAGVAYPEIPFRDRHCEHMPEPWWILEEGDPDRLNPPARRYLERVGCDWWPVLWTKSRAERERAEYLSEEGRDWIRDRVTGERRELFAPWQPRPQQEQPPREPLGESEVLAGQQTASAEEQIASGCWDLARATVQDLGRDYFIYSYTSVPFPLSFGLGFERTMYKVADDPGFLHLLADRIVARQREYFRAMARVGVHGVWMQEWYSGAELISRASYRELVLSHGRELVEEAQAQGLVVLHCFMGNPADRADLVAAMGAEVLLFEEGRKGYEADLATLAREIGREDAVLMGNLASERTLQQGTEAELAAEVRRLVDLGKARGRFLFSTGSPPTPETPLGRIRRMVDLARERWAGGGG